MQVMKTAEVAKMLRMSPSKVRQLTTRARDPLPGFRDGRTWRYRKDLVENWFERQVSANTDVES